MIKVTARVLALISKSRHKDEKEKKGPKGGPTCLLKSCCLESPLCLLCQVIVLPCCKGNWEMSLCFVLLRDPLNLLLLHKRRQTVPEEQLALCLCIPGEVGVLNLPRGWGCRHLRLGLVGHGGDGALRHPGDSSSGTGFWEL